MTTFAPAASLRRAARRPALRGWALAGAVYFLAVFHRSSLGVAGLIAEQRFGIGPAQLSVFVMLQIGVYAAMQVPTGVLVDRYGPRRMLVAAAAVMGSAQLLFALAPSYPMALVARTLLGCGDAMTFVSVLRFAAAHFSPRRYPLLVALTSLIGTVGNLAATLPLAALLRSAGWTPAFGIAASLSLVSAVAIWVLLDDGTVPPRRLHDAAEMRTAVRKVSRRVAAAWARPGTRLGFWVHFSCMTVATTFGVLWGYPYLIAGVGFSRAGAGTVLFVGVLGSGAASPLVGWLIGHRPAVRVPLALSLCTTTVVGWLVVALALGDHPPRALVLTLFVVTMLGGPASMVAFSLARDYNRAHLLGTASGVVNVGGFLATVLAAVGFGWLLDLQGGTSAHALRLALLALVAVQAFGTARVLIWYRRVRASVLGRQRSGEPVPVAVTRRHWWDLPDQPAREAASIALRESVAVSGNPAA